jgi:VCBS repeat-containing protein
VGGESGTATIIDNDLDTPKVSIIDDVDNDEFISKAELGDDNVQVEVAVNGEKLQLGGVVTLTIANGDGQERTVSLSLNVNGDLVDENGTPQISFSYSDGVIAWTENVMDGDAITVSAFQTDAHGNQSAIGADTATVDITATEAPTVTITEDVNNDGVISNAELVGKVNVEIGLPTGAVAGDTLTVTGQEPMVLTEEQITAGKVQFEFDRLKDGSTLVVDATVTDKAGNVSEPGTDSAKFDTLTIAYINDNGAPIEGDNAEFIVTLTQATSSDVTIKLLPTFDSAASADDVDLQNMTASYVNSSGDTVMLSITENGNVTIPAGVISINISIPIVDDAIVEGVEHFKLAIKGVDGVVASDSATIGIIDNDFSDGDENVSTAEDHVTSGNVLNNVTNLASIFTVSVSSFTVNGQTYSLTDSDSKIATISGVGTFTLSADGGYSFIPEQDYNGSVPDISYTVTNGSGTDVTSTLSIEVTAVDDVTVTVSDKGLTNEDTTLSVNAANGVLSNDSDVDSAFTVATYSINNVTYQAGDTVVVKGSGDDSDKDIGSLTLRADGSYEFVPAADWSGDVPTVSYTTSTGESADLDIKVTPVTDAPTVSLTLNETSTTTLFSVDLSNARDGSEGLVGNPAGFTVTAKNGDGNVVDISIKDSGSPTGFGVTGQAGNGADSEIGKQEKLVVELDKPASSATFELAWLNSYNETAVYKVNYSDGTSETFTVDGNTAEGGYDQIGTPITVSAPEGKSILAIEFSTPTTGGRVDTSDYVLHSVSYESAVTNYTVDVTATPTDTDYSESITDLKVTTPEGTSLSGAEKLGTENGVTTWKISLSSGGFTNNIEIDSETGVVTVKGLVLSVPDDFNGELTVTATATANDPGASATAEGSDSATLEINHAPVSSGGSVEGDEDTSLTLSWNELNVSDSDGDSSLSIKVTQLSGGGELQVQGDNGSWQTVVVGSELTKAQFDEGKVRFVPDENESGVDGYGGTGVGNQQADYAVLKFVPSDGEADGEEASLTIDIRPVADDPDLTISLGALVSNNSSGLTFHDGNITISIDGSSISVSGDGKVVTSIVGTSGNVNIDSNHADVIVLDGPFSEIKDGTQSLNSVNGNNLDYLYLTGPASDYTFSNVNQHVGSGIDGQVSDGTRSFSFNNVAGIIFGDGTSYRNDLDITKSTGSKTYELDLNAELTDTDGSESLSGITLSGVPSGATIQGEGVSQLGNGDWYIVKPTGKDFGDLGLTITVPNGSGGFTITATVSSTESVGGEIVDSQSTQASSQHAELTLGVAMAATSVKFTDDVFNDSTRDSSSASDTFLDWGNDQSKDRSSLSIEEAGSSSNGFSSSSELVVAKLTHVNDETSAYKDSLTSTKLAITVSLTINGQTVNVDLSSLIKTTDTVNSGNQTGDTITLTQSMTTVDVNGVSYKVFLDGFLDSNNQVVTTVTTPENQTATYSIVAHVEPMDSTLVNTISGTLSADTDGLDHVVATSVTDSYGVFVTHEDGSYTYTASDSLTGALGKGHSQVVNYEYTAVDKDGNSVVNTINITVNGTGSTVTESSDTTFEDMSHLVDQVYAGTSSIQTGAGYDGNIFNTNWNDGGWSNTLYGGDSSLLKSGNDTIHGNGGNDTIYGRGGNDLLTGDDGNDWIDGGSGNDSISGGAGSDELYGGSGNDLLDGGSGNDYLSGGAGNDILIGGAGDDSLLGGDDNDVLIGGSGNDTLTGGAGADLFVLNNASIDTITDFNAKDDALDLTDLLTGVAGDPGADASADAIASFLSAHVTVTDKHVKVDGSDVAIFGSGSNFDSNGSGSVTAADSIKVIYNDQEYNINIDG